MHGGGDSAWELGSVRNRVGWRDCAVSPRNVDYGLLERSMKYALAVLADHRDIVMPLLAAMAAFAIILLA